MARHQASFAGVSGGIAMYRVVYWSGVTLFFLWSVFSALGALHVF